MRINPLYLANLVEDNNRERLHLVNTGRSIRYLILCACSILALAVLDAGSASAQIESISDFVVTWEDDQDNNDLYQIYAHGFASEGSQAFGDRVVNSNADGTQINQSIAVDDFGNFVVVWQDDMDGNDVYQIYARGFNNDGTQRFADIVVNSVADGQQRDPVIAMDAVGNFVVAWEDDADGNGSYQIRARGFDSNGKQRLAEFTVNSVGDGQQLNPSIAMNAEGLFVVAWDDDQDGNGAYQVYGRGFNADGSQRFGDKKINTVDDGQQFDSTIAMDDLGHFVVAWEDDNDSNGVYQIYARGFNSDGTQRFAFITVNSIADGQQRDPAIAMDAAGNFVVTWEDDSDNNGAYQIRARGFRPDGTQRLVDFTVNPVPDGQQTDPVIAMDASGHFVIAWEDDRDSNGSYQIYARGYNPDSSQRFAEIVVNSKADGNQRDPAIAMVRTDVHFIPTLLATE